MKHRWITLPGLLAAWAAYSWLRYRVASERVEECYNLITSTNQLDVCIRNAIETRDAIVSWGFGLPLAGLIGAVSLRWMLSALANERNRDALGTERSKKP